MFVLDEIDKILQNIAAWGFRGRDVDKMKISLEDIEKVDVNQLQITTKVRYRLDPSYSRNTEPGSKIPKIFDLDESVASYLSHLSSDTLFANLITPTVLIKLTQIPERQYPSAKLIICDRPSYDMLMKLKRISLLKEKSNNNEGRLKNFIHKSPFNVTAIFLLSDIMDLFNRQSEPVIRFRYDRSSGKRQASYNYLLARKVFPFLKMSDLVILLLDKGQLQLGRFNLQADKQNHVLQLLNYFSRSTQLIELNSLTRLMGRPHMIYNNVLIFQPIKEENVTRSVYDRLSLSHITFMADRLVQVAEKLRLNLKSISYRAGDPDGQTKVFSQLVASCISSKQLDPTTESYTPARVIVVDRSHDLLTPLYHADRYGAFLEQEKQTRMTDGRLAKLRMDTVDELDEKLQQNQLADVLGTILRYSMSLKNQQIEVGARINPQSPLPKVNQNLSSAMATSQSIRRHLDLVKLIYRCLHEGYLLVLRLEMSLESISNLLRSLTVSISSEEQVHLSDRLQRILTAFKQLNKTSGSSIKAMDLIRIACIMVDIINMFAHICRKANDPKVSSKNLNEIREYIFSSKDFNKSLKSKLDPDDKVESSDRLIEKIVKYDRISREKCGDKSIHSLEQIVEKHYSMELDKDAFPIINLSKEANESEVIILIILGSLTPNELSRLKAMESAIKKRQKLKDIFILTSGIADPEDFLAL